MIWFALLWLTPAPWLAHCKERVIDLESQYAIDLYFDWQAAWNARGKVDAAECQRMNSRAPIGGPID